ncbi:MAG: hypothetical protein AAFZ15_03810 [Bacteroidota bacterium]
MSKVLTILLLRLKQGWRATLEVGVVLVLFALLITFGLAIQILVALQEMGWSTIGQLSFAGILSVHAARKDLLFLQSICSNRWTFKSVLASEYLLLLSPLILLYACSEQWWHVLSIFTSTLLFVALAHLIPVSRKRPIKKSLHFIPLDTFEIKSRVEKAPLLFILIYALGFLTFFHVAFFPISIIIMSAFLVDTFKYLEPVPLVHWKKNFVGLKIKRNLGFLLLIFLPPFLTCLLFQWAFIWVAIYAMIILITVTILAICFKYANYSPLYAELASSNTMSLLLLLSFLPGFILITIGYSIFLYFKAKKNMEYYFGEKRPRMQY